MTFYTYIHGPLRMNPNFSDPLTFSLCTTITLTFVVLSEPLLDGLQ